MKRIVCQERFVYGWNECHECIEALRRKYSGKKRAGKE